MSRSATDDEGGVFFGSGQAHAVFGPEDKPSRLAGLKSVKNTGACKVRVAASPVKSSLVGFDLRRKSTT